jgi:hypothetical protein
LVAPAGAAAMGSDFRTFARKCSAM